MTTYLGKSCSFCLPRVPFVNCRQFMYLVISLLVLRAGYGIWLYQFLIIAYLFIFYHLNTASSRCQLKYLRWTPRAIKGHTPKVDHFLWVVQFEWGGPIKDKMVLYRPHESWGNAAISWQWQFAFSVAKKIRNPFLPCVTFLGNWSTRTRVNSYPSQLVPFLVNSYPFLVNSYLPSQLVPVFTF